jgi:hypothetical protein
MNKKNRRIALGKETLRHLDEAHLGAAAAAELTGTASFTCQNRTCGNCVTGYLASCRCTPVVG